MINPKKKQHINSGMLIQQFPAGIWCQNDLVLTSMVPKLRRIDVHATSSRRMDANATSFLRHVLAGKPQTPYSNLTIAENHVERCIGDTLQLDRIASYGECAFYPHRSHLDANCFALDVPTTVIFSIRRVNHWLNLTMKLVT